MQRPIHRIWIALLALILLAPTSIMAQSGRTTVFFLHHSCGANLIEEGGVREALTDLGYDFYDHGYNESGLRLPDGSFAGRTFDIPGDNTDPDGLAELFAQPRHDPPDNAFSHLMQYDVIAFKSCFPVSNIADDAQLERYKQYYRSIRDRMDQHPNKAFIIVTQPPQVPRASNRQEAARARAWTQWLQSDEFLAGHPNVFVFDFFDYLAGDDNFLRRAYRYNNSDAHPNTRANEAIAPHFVAFIDHVATTFEPGAPGEGPNAPQPTDIAPTSTAAPPEEDRPDGDQTAPGEDLMGPDVDLITGAWSAAASDPAATVTCTVDPAVIHEGRPTVRMTFDLPEGTYGDCAHTLDAHYDGSPGAGYGLWTRADAAGEVILTLFAGPLDGPTPFEARLALDGSGAWQRHTIPWSAFERAPWDDGTGLASIDPARIAGYTITAEGYDGAWAVTLHTDPLGAVDVTAQDAGAAPTPAATSTTPPQDNAPGDTGGAGLCPAALALPPAALLLALRRRRTAGTPPSQPRPPR